MRKRRAIQSECEIESGARAQLPAATDQKATRDHSPAISKLLRAYTKHRGTILVTLIILLVFASLFLRGFSAFSGLSSLRGHRYDPIQQSSDTYDVFHCPRTPPPGYPREYPILAVLDNWNVNNVNDPPQHIYQGVCIFDLAHANTSALLGVMRRQIQTYRRSEVPFVVRNDPAVLQSVALWSNLDYLSSRLGAGTVGRPKHYQATLSNTTIMTYFALAQNYNIVPDDFVPFTQNVPMTFPEWYARATSATYGQQHHNQYAYLRLDACLADKDCDSTYRGDPQLDNADFIYEDLPFFQPTLETQQNPSQHQQSLYQIDPNKSRGIQCRFGTPGLTAENHFDNERNYIAMLKGERRYLLGHPKNCGSMYLYPQKHPLARHSRVDWSRPPTRHSSEFPAFENTTVNEVVLQAGDVLYVPTYWFHHIVSLTVNYQCNTRSGYSVEYDQTIYDCGFFYDFPSSR